MQDFGGSVLESYSTDAHGEALQFFELERLKIKFLGLSANF